MHGSVKCMLPCPFALCMHGLWHGPLTLKFKFFKWSCLSYVKTDYFDWKFKSRNFLKRARPRMQAPLHSPKSLKIPSLTNQINPSSYLLTHYHSQNPKSLPKPKKYQKRQKMAKHAKNVKMKIGSYSNYSSPLMITIIPGGKKAKNTSKQPDVVGLSKKITGETPEVRSDKRNPRMLLRHRTSYRVIQKEW